MFGWVSSHLGHGFIESLIGFCHLAPSRVHCVHWVHWVSPHCFPPSIVFFMWFEYIGFSFIWTRPVGKLKSVTTEPNLKNENPIKDARNSHKHSEPDPRAVRRNSIRRMRTQSKIRAPSPGAATEPHPKNENPIKDARVPNGPNEPSPRARRQNPIRRMRTQ